MYNSTQLLTMLNSVLRVYCSNFDVLHWNAVGEEFNDAHVNIAEGYGELFHKYVDPTAEMLTRLGQNPLNYVEVLELLKSCDKDYLLVDSKRLYARADIIRNSDIMLGNICELLASCIESFEGQSINAGIKSTLESILEDFDLQYRYINKRRLGLGENATIKSDNESEE